MLSLLQALAMDYQQLLLLLGSAQILLVKGCVMG
jgi:hypothetical protein